MRAIARFFADLLGQTPIAGFVAIRAARAPLWLKSPAVTRIIEPLARHWRRAPQLVVTNMGLKDGLKVRIPDNKYSYLYGRALDYLPERSTLELATVLGRQSGAFIDVGAHEGIFAFAVSDGKVPLHLFEPDPELFHRMSGNLADNGVSATLNKTALGDTVGKTTFYRDLDDDTSGSISTYFTDKHRTEATEIDVTTLSHYMESQGVNRVCVKIDVEGAARNVWTGMKDALHRIDFIICEMLEPEINTNLPGSIIRAGFHAYHIRDYDLLISERGEWDGAHPFYNWLFSKCSPDDLRKRLRGTRFNVFKPERTNPERQIVE